MDTEVTIDHQSAPSSATARSAEELSGHDNAAAIGQLLHASLDDHAKSPDATTDASLLAERFAGIVYFASSAGDGHGERRSTHHRAAAGSFGAEPVRSKRSGRTPTRPWRLPTDNGTPKS
jgi:hypothetical protein